MVDLTDDQKKLKDFTKKKLQEKGVIDSPAETNNLTQEQENLIDWTKNKLADKGITETSVQQRTGGTFLPGIDGISNQISTGSNIKSSLGLPGITSNLSAPTSETIKEGSKWANKNDVDKKSWNEKIEYQAITNDPGLTKGVKRTWNDIKKRLYRGPIEIADSLVQHPIETFQKLGVNTSVTDKLLGKLGDQVISPGLNYMFKEKINNMWNNYDKYEKQINDSMNERIDKNMDKHLQEKYEKGGGLWGALQNKDWNMVRYGVKQGAGTSIIPMIPGIIAGIVTRNPYITAGVTFGVTEPIEDQGAYEEAIKNGATREEALKIGRYAGQINSLLEILTDLFQLKPLFKPLKNTFVKSITKKSGRQIILRGIGNISKGIFGEGLTEATQEFVTNALVKTINDNYDLMGGVLESFLIGSILGGGPSTIGAGGGVINDIETNKVVDVITDIEAMNYVQEGEHRKNQKKKLEESKQRLKEQLLGNEGTEETNQKNQRAEETTNDIVEQEMINEVLNENRGSTTTETTETTEIESDGRYQKVAKGESTELTDIKNDLQEIKDKMEEMDNKRFFNKIKASINKGGKNYIVTTNQNGEKTVLRVVERGTGKGSKGKTVTIQVMKPSKKSGSVNVSNFTYNPGNLTIEQQQGIITGFENWINNGEFDLGGEKYQGGVKYEEEDYVPGIASKKEKNILGKEGIKMKNKINDQTIEELANKYGIRVDVIKGMIKILENGKWDGSYAYGKYLDQVLTLSEQIKESTAPHELLHAIFDMLDPDTKTYLIAQVMKSEGWSAEKSEEWLADTFANFFLTGKIDGAPKSTWGRIKVFFKKVRAFINGLGKWRTELNDIFTNIITADNITDLQSKIDKNEQLNQAKEQMKKRFLGYAKNAQKIEKKMSGEKYMRGYHGSHAEFDKFDSSHMGEGEGAQAHGWGIYIAINKETGKHYAELKKDLYTYDPKKFEKLGLEEKSLIEFILNDVWNSGETLEDYIEGMIDGYETQMKYDKVDGYFKKNFQKKIDFLKSLDLNDFKSVGDGSNLYEVEIPDPEKADTPTGWNYIEEKPHNSDPNFKNAFITDEQIIEFANLLKRYNKDAGRKFLNRMGTLYANKSILGEDLYKELSSALGSKKEASKFLESLGYDGIHYFGGRDGEAYVIFNDNDLEIVNHEKYQSAGDINSEAFKKRFGDSKVVNEDGSPKIMYHGTPNKGFTVFKEGYFTENKEYADKYQNPNASSIRFNKKADNPGTYAVYLSIKNPFDTRDPKAKKIFEKEYFGNYGMGTPLGEKGLPDRMDGVDLQEFIMENHPEYDGLILDEGGIGGYGEDVKDRGLSYVPFYPNQIKSATDNVGTYDASNPDIRYQKVEDFRKETDKNWKSIAGETPRELEQQFRSDIEERMEDAGYDPSEYEIGEVVITGSRARGYAKKNSDIDVVVEFIGDNLREDDLFNALNEKKLKYEGIDVDFNPILDYESGDLEYYLEKQEKYMGGQGKYQDAGDTIDPNIKNPREMVHDYGGLMVMDKFISEKQRDKAYDVNEALLVQDGRWEGHPYMWMHTNKYATSIIPNFENVKDSRYKEFNKQGIEVTFFTNNEDMSKSYADQKSKLAKTKKFNSIEEFNKMFEDKSARHKSEISGNPIKTHMSNEIVKDGKQYVLHKKWEELIKYKSIDDMYRGTMPRDIVEGLNDDQKIEAVKKYSKDNFMGADWGDSAYDGVEIIRDGKDVIYRLWKDTEIGKYKSEQEALAKGRSAVNNEGTYHYRGIIQNMHNPLVVKIPNVINPLWNNLGTAYDALIKTPNGKKGLNKIKKKLLELQKQANDILEDLQKAVYAEKVLQNVYRNRTQVKLETEKDVQGVKDQIKANIDGREKISNFLISGGELEKLTPLEANSEILDGKTLQDVWNKAKKMYDNNKDYFEAIKKPVDVKYLSNYKNPPLEGFTNYLFELGEFNAGEKSLFYNVYLNPGYYGGRYFWNVDVQKELEEKRMTTNDWVFYALNKGGYDGVVFKGIDDYGGKSIRGHIGGDVAVTFSSSQFKSWDNSDPTDSKYISYQRAGDINSEAFKKRFGDWENDPENASKVVNENGKPLAVIHETYWDALNEPKGKAVFDKNRSENGGFRFSDIGSTPGYEYGDNKLKVYLNLRNPLIIEEEHYPGRGTIIGRMMEGDYDGVIVKGGTRMDGKPHTVYVVREPNQIKSATDNVGTYDASNPDIRYQKADSDNRMVALHNLTYEKLAKAKDLGGLVAPSVAITKSGIPFENYGEITFIANKGLVNPSEDVVVGETDLYTPRVPKPTLEWKDGVTREQQEKIAEKLGMRWVELNEYIYNGGDTYYERSYPNLAKEVEPLIEKKLFKGFTEMGDRIYEEYNISNILKEMFSEGDVGAESAIFQGSLSEAMARMSDGVKDLEDVRSKIGDKEGLDKEYDALSDKYTDLGWDMLGGRDGMAIFSENIRKSNSEIVEELADYDIEVTEKQVQQLKNIVKKALKLPKSYVEAKIKRGVGFNEFTAVVVPEDKVKDVQALIGNDIDVYGYKPGERMDVIEAVANDKGAKFQRVRHGSPADFENFDSSHMGEGEGAQVHGWGHYVAVNKDTGKHYAGMKHYNNEVEINGVVITNPNDLYKIPYSERSLYEEIFNAFSMRTYDSFEEDLQKIINRKKEDYENVIDHFDQVLKEGKYGFETVYADERAVLRHRNEYIRALEKLEELDLKDVKVRESNKKRNLYEVEIPDPVKANTPTGSNYLEEDGNLSESEINKVIDKLNIGKSWNDVTISDIEKLQDAENGWYKQGNEFVNLVKYSTKSMKENLDQIMNWYAGTNEVMQDKLLSQVGIRTNAQNKILAFIEKNKGKIKGRDLYHILDRYFRNDKKASKFLESLGYDGIHYFGGRDGEAYVIFNDNDLEIVNHEKYQSMEDNEGRELSTGQIIHFADSKARIDEDLDKPLVRVRHTTTNNLKRPFSIFNPVGTPYYRFGEDVVMYFTDNEEMSASYANGGYIKYDLEGKIRSVKDAKEYLKKLREEGRHEFATGLPMQYTLKKEGNGYKLYNGWDQEEVNDMEELWKEADLTKREMDALEGAYTYKQVNKYAEAIGEEDTNDIWQTIFSAEHKLKTVAIDRGTPFGQKYGLSSFYRTIFEHRKNPKQQDTGIYFESAKDLINNLENEIVAREWNKQKWMYEGYLNITNPYIIDAEGRNWDTVRMGRTLLEDILDRWDKKSESEKKKIIKVFEDAKQEFEEGEENEGWDWYSYGMRNEDLKDAIHEVMGNTLMLELDASSEMYGAQIVGDAVDTVLGGMKKEDIQSFLNSTVGNSDAETTNDVVKFVIESNKKGETNYDGVIIKNVIDYGSDRENKRPHNVYVVFASRQFKSIYNLNPTDNEDIRYQKTEYEYDENGNPTNIKFGDNSEWNPKIFGDNNRQEQIEEDMEKEKNNAFYPAWIRYNNQNYEDDKLTFAEFMNAIAKWGEQKQEEYDQHMRDISDSQADPYLLELQLRAVKLVEEEQNVGKKFGKNVSKEVRDKQQAEVEKKREELSQDIYEYMYPGLKFEDATYEDKNNAWNQEAEWEMLGREDIEKKLKLYKKDSNGSWVAKEVKIENPNDIWNRIEKSGNFSEIFAPVDRVLEWKTPEGQKGRIDSVKDPKQFKKVMEKINSGKTKTKVTLRDVTKEARALEKAKAMEEAEKERIKKERQEAMQEKKKQEYKKMVRLKAFQRLVDMQRFEKYPFLTEQEIKERWGFTDDEWKKITEQEDLKFPPKKYGEKAIKDFNKAVDEEVRFIIEGLSWQNTMKQKEAEKNLGEISDIDVDVLLGKDEEKGAKEVEEFRKLAENKGEDTTKKRLKEARDNVMDVEIDKERENSKSEKERVDKLIKSTKSDKTVWGSIKEFTSNILTPVSTKIRNISPKIHREVMRYFQNKDIKTNERLKEVDPFLKAMKKIRKENPVRFMDIWVALANRNIGYANGLLKEYGVTVPTDLLDTIYDEAQDVGLNINYLGSYYPLSVKAPRKFLEELMKVKENDIASEIEKRIMEESQKKGGPLEEAEITSIINSVIAGEEDTNDVNIGNAHMKKRNTEIKRTQKMLEYCDDPISTLISYIEGMTQSIERAKFLGKSRSGNVHTLADYVYNAKNGLTPNQQDELMDLLKAVFNDANPSKSIQAWRDIATLTTLGSPSSTLTQLGDLSFSVYENGWRETLKAVWDIFMKRKAFNLIDMGVLNRGEEYTNINSQKNLLQKAIHNVFKLTFFSQFDTFGKSAFIQSTWNKWVKRAKKGEKGDAQLRKDIMKRTDDEFMTEKIINDLRNNNFSQEVALVMYMKLSNIQPLTRAQMPKAYLNNPNGRLFYQFKTFGIKQLDYVLQETKNQTKDFKKLPTTEKLLRIAQIANMIFVMTLLGCGADELKDLTMRRKSNSLILRRLFGENVGSEQIWEKIEDNVLKLFGLSRYTVMQMKSDPIDAITSLFTTLPATNIVNYPFKDIYKAFKNDGSINWRNPSSYQLIPVIGKYRYWIYGGGQDKQEQTLQKEKKKGKNKKGGGIAL